MIAVVAFLFVAALAFTVTAWYFDRQQHRKRLEQKDAEVRRLEDAVIDSYDKWDELDER